MGNSTQAQSSSIEISDNTVEPKIETPTIDSLLKRIDLLSELVVRMAHNSGVSHTLLKKAGLEPYNPTRSDMSKFKGG